MGEFGCEGLPLTEPVVVRIGELVSNSKIIRVTETASKDPQL
jgi:hypothetical protein